LSPNLLGFHDSLGCVVERHVSMELKNVARRRRRLQLKAGHRHSSGGECLGGGGGSANTPMPTAGGSRSKGNEEGVSKSKLPNTEDT